MTLGPLMIDLVGPSVLPEERDMLAHPLVGGVILFARNYESPAQLLELTAAIQATRTPPLLIAVDHEGGRVQRFRSGFSRLPPARRIGQLFDTDHPGGLAAARQMGWLMAAELRAHGVDLSFAPTVDLDYGLNEAIGDRALHPTADATAQLAVAYMMGMRDAGMAATAKHFPGHGAVAADSHVALPVDRRELADLSEDLTPYRRLIANGLPGVMVAHILLPAEDAAPASLSARWIRGVLRTDLNFQGAVFTDDLSMGAVAAGGDIIERCQRALAAGCDMLLVCNDPGSRSQALAGLKASPDPASQLRLIRMRGRERLSPEQLHGAPQWSAAQQLLTRLAAAPALSLTAEGA
ncbi:MAG TPA: beta-N-acetylhexosaminidase [Steroidobacteraceae bacterium]|jgi:beta-N-acetylhexosaminidase|nr:beta-N-acetylhexosaminidase [Steroidobacteraceae bacterium]